VTPESQRYVRAVNGTGVFLHTGLGRAPFSQAMLDDLSAALAGYTVVEVDPRTGERDLRERAVVESLLGLTGAPAGTVVNNNAAAILLAATVLAAEHEVLVSRGELIEIGGGFRIPEVLANSGAKLREVGTTNHTRIEDYEAAFTADTRLILRVHASNYRIVGDHASPDRVELVSLAQKRGVPLMEDLGSGLIDRFGMAALDGEPTAREALAEGVDVVTFSGDKLLGGPQSGLILGKEPLIGEMRRAPLFRAVRPDKIVLALLEQVLNRYPRSPQGIPRLPFYQALARSPDSLRAAAEELAQDVRQAALAIEIDVISSQAFAGSGSVPVKPIPSYALSLTPASLRAHDAARRLRQGRPPLYVTLERDAIKIDVFTLLAGEFPVVVEALKQLEREP